MKTSKFFLSTLIAAAAMSANAWAANTLTTATTTITDSSALSEYEGTYSGNIIEITAKGNTGFHDGTFTVYSTDENGIIGDATEGLSGTISVTLTNGGTSSGNTLWQFFAGTGAQVGSSTCGHTLYVSSNTLSSDFAPNMTFGPAALGGLIVGASDHTFTTGRTDSNIVMQLKGAPESGFVANIGSDTVLNAGSGFVLGTGTWTIASGKSVTLNGGVSIEDSASVIIAGEGEVVVNNAITVNNSGTITFAEGASLAFNGEGTTVVNGLDVTTNGLQEVDSTITYTLASGSGSISGLTTSNLTLNGVAASTISADCKTATIEGESVSVYNVATSTSVDISTVTTAIGNTSVDYVNVAGTLTGLGTTMSSNDIRGSGLVQVDDGIMEYHNQTFLENFTGVVEITKTDSTSGEVRLGNVAGSKFQNVSSLKISSGGILAFWGGTFNRSLELAGGTINAGGNIGFSGEMQVSSTSTLNTAGSTINVDGAVSGEGGLIKTGTGTLTFNGAVDLGSLSAEGGTVTFNSTANISTLTVDTDKTLNLNGVHNLTAESVVLNGSLRLGNLSDGQNVNLAGLTGGGFISVSKTQGNHGHTVNLGTSFTGTVELVGYFDPGKLTLGSGEQGVIRLNGVWFWGSSATFNKEVEFVESGDVVVGSGSTGKNYSTVGMTFKKGATFLEGSKFQIAGDFQNWSTISIKAGSTLTLTGSDVTLSAWSGTNQGNKVLNVAEGGVLTSTSTLKNDSGLTVTNDGLIKTTGILTYVTDRGWSKNAFSGSGVVVANQFNIANLTQFVFQNHTFVIGALTFEAIGSTTTSGDVRFGNATIGATKNWSSSKSVALTGTDGTEATETTFNTGVFDEATKTFSSETGYTIELSGVLSGAGAIVKDGAGTLKLAGDNTYTGGTTISQGTLVAAHANALGRGPVDILSGATLQADTQITLSNDLTLNVTENDLVSLSRESNTPLITGNGVELAQNASLYVNIGALAREETLALQLAAGSALLVEESQIKIGAWVDSTWWEDEYYTEVSWNSETGVLTLAIPEPSLFGLLAGLGALTLVGTRRRRAKKD